MYRKSNKYFCIASLLLLAQGCGEQSEAYIVDSEQGSAAIEFAVAVSSASASRVAIGEDWSMIWDEDDELIYLGYSTISESWCSAKLSTILYDEHVSTFGAKLSNASGIDYFRLIYPYQSDAIADDSTIYTVDLSSQQAGLCATQMISSELIPFDDNTATMSHIGAVVLLRVNFGAPNADYLLESVAIEGLMSSATVDVECSIDDPDFYLSTSQGAIQIALPEPLVADTVADVRFNIIPSVIAAGESLSVTYTVSDAEGASYNYVDQVVNTSAASVDFARATYNTINSTCDLSDIGYYPAISSISAEVDAASVTFELAENCAKLFVYCYPTFVAADSFAALYYTEEYIVDNYFVKDGSSGYIYTIFASEFVDGAYTYQLTDVFAATSYTLCYMAVMESGVMGKFMTCEVVTPAQ
ncbi:MAG: hypothetical protein SNI45_00900 [Rikenellaceae bacterium]